MVFHLRARTDVKNILRLNSTQFHLRVIFQIFKCFQKNILLIKYYEIIIILLQILYLVADFKLQLFKPFVKFFWIFYRLF